MIESNDRLIAAIYKCFAAARQCEVVSLVSMALYEVRSLGKVDRARNRVEFRR